MKPDVSTAMQQFIDQARLTFPFGRPEAEVCAGPCDGCSMKLLAFLETELDDWESRLASGDRPGLAEFSKLMRTSRKIARVLHKGGLMDVVPDR
jgi:hypothetical protein